MVIKIGNTTPRGCATIATISTVEPKNLGIVLMTNSTLTACARIATSILTTAKGEKRRPRRGQENKTCRVLSKSKRSKSDF